MKRNKSVFENQNIPFNGWSRERIQEGRKICTSRHRRYPYDRRIIHIGEKMRWGEIRRCYWRLEGADSESELQEQIEKIYGRPVPDEEMFYPHFGDFRPRHTMKKTKEEIKMKEIAFVSPSQKKEAEVLFYMSIERKSALVRWFINVKLFFLNLLFYPFLRMDVVAPKAKINEEVKK